MRIWDYYFNLVKQNRKWLKFVFIWFIISAIIGGLYYLENPELLRKILEIFQQKFGLTPDLNFNLALKIFYNNLLVAVICLGGGALFGLAPFFLTFFNGFVIGYVLVSVLKLTTIGIIKSIWFLFLSLAPHGILELPIILICAALGLRLGLNFLKKQPGASKTKIFLQDLKMVLLFFPLVAVLLFCAALIEVFITPKIIGL